MSVKRTLRSMGLGRLAYHLWFQPKARIRTVIAAGGPLAVRRDELARREMELAVENLPAPRMPLVSRSLELHLLTGKRFWYQTAFCLWSFARHACTRIIPVVYDDGTLAGQHRDAIGRLFPHVRFISREETVARLDSCLPEARFPTLRERWRNYVHIRKLTDVHVGQSGWKLVLDSDLLFFRRPTFLVDWLENPTMPLHAVDCESSYGYSQSLMKTLTGKPIPPLVNVGLTGLNGGNIDWEQLEYWARTLIEEERPHYFLEQALVAMLVAGSDCAIAPSTDYITKPAREEAEACRAVMHHYVADSKRWYFRHCWRAAIKC